MSTRTYNKDMGYSFKEFFRPLPLAFESSAYDVNGRTIHFDAGEGKTINITLGVETVRQIALMAIPLLPVTLELIGYSDDEANVFMATFDRAYHRGGG